MSGWDDPRLLTLAGLRRRGFTASAINAFCRGVGITRADNVIRDGVLEHAIRDELNRTAPRALAVLRPLRVVLTNYPEGPGETVPAQVMPADPAAGTYQVAFSRVVYIEETDFRAEDTKDFYGEPSAEPRLQTTAHRVAPRGSRPREG